MKKIVQLLTELPDFLKNSLETLFSSYQIEQLLFFDIETTGLSAKVSSLYLIGACFYNQERQKFQIIQYFAEEFDDEIRLLKEFYQLSRNFSVLLHYNGRTFDLPYLNAKCEAYQLPFRFGEKNGIENTDKNNLPDNIDIYQIFHKDKFFFNGKRFPLKNKKQKTMELLAGYSREDILDGKELIRIYNKYHKEHLMQHETAEASFLELLLLHNHDDLCGLVSICPLLGYTQLFTKDFTHFTLKECRFSCEKSFFSLEQPIPSGSPAPDCILSLELETDFLFLPISGQRLTFGEIHDHGLSLRIPGKFAELKFFYPDYKNYYYLPEEDMAIHKSIAEFVDRKRRCKAKPEDCYTKKRSFFFPQPAINPPITPAFYEEYHGKTAWFEWNAELAQKKESIAEYALSMLSL